MPIITYTQNDDLPRKAVVTNDNMADWIASREAQGAVIERIDFGPGERASIVLATTTSDPAGELALMRTDLAMARVVEDLFEALKTKGVLADADLPDEARQKIAARDGLRETVK
jgi:hypothetical protein